MPTRKLAVTERERSVRATVTPLLYPTWSITPSGNRPASAPSTFFRKKMNPDAPNALVQACPRLAWRLLRRRHDRRGHCL